MLRSFLALVLVALASVPSSCAGPGSASSLGLVSRAVVGSTSVEVGPPIVLGVMAWDGDTLLAGGQVGASIGVFLRDTGASIYPPREFSDGAAIVRVRSTGFEWKGQWGDPLPEQARFAFRPGEAEAWGIKFQGDAQ